MNLVLGLLVLGGSALAVWGGITDPAGGVLTGVRNAIHGVPNDKRTSVVGAAFMASLASAGAGGPLAPASYSPPAAGTPGGTTATGTRAAVIAQARTWLGVPYKWGGNTRAGVDCSGLTVAVYRDAAGVKLHRVSAMQQTQGQARTLATAQPADLVFFGYPAHHVGIYLGGGKILHSPKPGTVVRVESIWKGETVTVRDVLGSAAPKPSKPKPKRKGTPT